jgi:hypothetical protein
MVFRIMEISMISSHAFLKKIIRPTSFNLFTYDNHRSKITSVSYFESLNPLGTGDPFLWGSLYPLGVNPMFIR